MPLDIFLDVLTDEQFVVFSGHVLPLLHKLSLDINYIEYSCENSKLEIDICLGGVVNETILIIPGYDNSGPEHWQTHWERSLPNTVRVNQKDWLNPIKSEWVETLNQAIQKDSEPKLLVAHSLGCLATIEWANRYNGNIKGILLVAPPDLEAVLNSDTPTPIDPALVRLARQWIPVSHNKLPYPSVLIASSTDQYTKIENAQKLADRWGCKFINIGTAGHINDESGFGPWEEGKKYLLELTQ